jgi:hypothetical protein
MSSSLPPEGMPQTHYSESFGLVNLPQVLVASLVLGLCSLLAASLPGAEPLAVFLTAILKAVILGGGVLALATSPGFGIPRRTSLLLPSGDSTTLYTIKPLFARKSCEQVGGFRHSTLHGNTLDYNKQYVVYSVLGLVMHVRWESAILVVNL